MTTMMKLVMAALAANGLVAGTMLARAQTVLGERRQPERDRDDLDLPVSAGHELRDGQPAPFSLGCPPHRRAGRFTTRLSILLRR